jgi:hypothetical protein
VLLGAEEAAGARLYLISDPDVLPYTTNTNAGTTCVQVPFDKLGSTPAWVAPFFTDRLGTGFGVGAKTRR